MMTAGQKFLFGTTAALALLAGSGVHAQTVNGGGSTLASPTYASEFLQYENNTSADFSGYQQSGSGAAITAFLNDTSNVTNGPTPFDFGASDATITPANLAAWNTSSTGKAQAGLLIQIPTFGTPITVPLNIPGVASNSAVNLTDTDLCGMFSGKFTDYSQLTGSSGLPANGGFKIVFRSDNSGTTFLFTQHLAAVCNSGNSNVSFFATQTFASLFPSGSLPSNFVSGSGSPGVQVALNSATNSFGYLSPDYTRQASRPVGGNAALFTAEVNGVQPTSSNTQAALATGTPMTDPAAGTTTYDPNDPISFVPVAANPSTGYAIVGYTTFLLGQCYKDPTVAATLKSFISDLYSQGTYTSVIRAAGFASLPASLVGKILPAYLLTSGTSSSTINGVNSGCSKVAGR